MGKRKYYARKSYCGRVFVLRGEINEKEYL
nr:MAG TPA: hypothetical protein [Caudoviricetes sp.]